MRRMNWLLALLAMSFSWGCAQVQLAAPELDDAAKKFAVTQGKSNVYIYRNETMGAAVRMPLTLNGRLVAETGPNTYALLVVDSGKHTLVSKTENDSSLSLEVLPGRNYFVWQEVKMGLFAARSLLQLVDEEKGRAGVAECKRLELVK